MAKEQTAASTASDPYAALTKAETERAQVFTCQRCGGTVFDFRTFGVVNVEGDQKIGRVVRTDATCGTCHAVYPLDGVK